MGTQRARRTMGNSADSKAAEKREKENKKLEKLRRKNLSKEDRAMEDEYHKLEKATPADIKEELLDLDVKKVKKKQEYEEDARDAKQDLDEELAEIYEDRRTIQNYLAAHPEKRV